MTTLPITTNNKVEKSEGIPRGEIAYVTSRNQHTAHNMLLRAVKDSGKTQKELSRLTGIDEATISRTLRRPSNFEINTYSKLLYAACGAFIALAPSYPRAQTQRIVHASYAPGASESGNKTYTYRPSHPFSQASSEPHIKAGTTSALSDIEISAITNNIQILEGTYAERD